VRSPLLAIHGGFALFGHSNLRLRLRWVECLSVTPRRTVSITSPPPLRHNFGTLFSVWDRLVGTFVVGDECGDEPLGVSGDITTYAQRVIDAFREPARRLHWRRPARMSGREQHAA
jgi:sterol desaturase/sphingolipid hydroxylase (fatty acid hydroxylase superfamily)